MRDREVVPNAFRAKPEVASYKDLGKKKIRLEFSELNLPGLLCPKESYLAEKTSEPAFGSWPVFFFQESVFPFQLVFVFLFTF